jgi:thiopurine S-methyltransferase
MQQSFWQARWDEGRIGFHLGEVNPALVRHFSTWLGEGNASGQHRVLVPLCGKTLDLAWLCQSGLEVHGVEFVENAAKAYFEEHQLKLSVSDLGRIKRFSNAGLSLYIGDFFALQPSDFPAFDLIYDRAALVAIAPELRDPYAAQLARLSAPKGRLLLINLVHDMGGGPPFTIPERELRRILEPHFELEELSDLDTLESSSHFKERGASFFREQVWLGISKSG